MKRRDFLKTTGAGAVAGLTVLGGESKAQAAAPSIKEYRTLGRTGLKISDISFGGGHLSSPSLMARAVDMGINYIDTAPDYGPSEATIGRYLKQSGGRDKIHIASKFCHKEMYPGHLDTGASTQDYIDAVQGSLQRMNTDYLDVVFVHAMGEDGRGFEDRLLAGNMLEAYTKLKKAGKVRFLAVSSHGPNKMEKLLLAAVRSGHFDLIMPAHNFMAFPNVPNVIKEAQERNVGVIAMKTLAGAKKMNLKTGDEPFEHAAFKWVLQNRAIAGLIVTISNARDLKFYVEASGQAFTKSSQRTLDRYRTAFSSEYCRTGCGECLGSCPEGVNIAGVLRYDMYFSGYGQEKRAMEQYARIEPKADVCGGCGEAACESACPFGLPVRSLLGRAHENLTLAVS